MTELIDLFLPTPFNITFVVVVYLVHRSFHKVDLVGFAAVTALCLCVNFYMTAYLHVNQIVAMLTTLVGFPVLETLWSMGISGLHSASQPSPILYSPYPRYGRR